MKKINELNLEFTEENLNMKNFIYKKSYGIGSDIGNLARFGSSKWSYMVKGEKDLGVDVIDSSDNFEYCYSSNFKPFYEEEKRVILI